MKQGILLVNLGTPDSPHPDDVGRYLKQFLMDPFVVDIPKALRWFLVNVLIVPRRKFKSALAYETIWTPEGSPLAIHLKNLVRELQSVKSDAVVVGAMRYGNPSIEKGILELKKRNVTDVVVVPLYPQYAESSTRSSLVEVEESFSRLEWRPRVKTILNFFDDLKHADAWADLIAEQFELAVKTSDKRELPHVLLSYHGLPERHLKKSDASGNHCLDGGSPTLAESKNRIYACCQKAIESRCPALQTCYRAQSLRTSQLIVSALGRRGISLNESQWSMSFQSRLGRTPWIRPYTDDVIPALAKSGVKSLVVATPSFVADCLETIEEIGDRAKSDFLSSGGNEFRRVSCLNTSPSWLEALANLVDRN